MTGVWLTVWFQSLPPQKKKKKKSVARIIINCYNHVEKCRVKGAQGNLRMDHYYILIASVSLWAY